MKKEGFPKGIRIKKKTEFEQIVKKGKKTVGKSLILYTLDSEEKSQKFGINLNRNLKGAVRRNRIKRLLREILRKNKDKFKEHEKVLILYKSATGEESYQELLSEFEDLVG